MISESRADIVRPYDLHGEQYDSKVATLESELPDALLSVESSVEDVLSRAALTSHVAKNVSNLAERALYTETDALDNNGFNDLVGNVHGGSFGVSLVSVNFRSGTNSVEHVLWRDQDNKLTTYSSLVIQTPNARRMGVSYYADGGGEFVGKIGYRDCPELGIWREHNGTVFTGSYEQVDGSEYYHYVGTEVSPDGTKRSGVFIRNGSHDEFIYSIITGQEVAASGEVVDYLNGEVQEQDSTSLQMFLNAELQDFPPTETDIFFDLDETLFRSNGSSDNLRGLWRPDARTVLTELQRQGYHVGIFSSARADYIAAALGVYEEQFGVPPPFDLPSESSRDYQNLSSDMLAFRKADAQLTNLSEVPHEEYGQYDRLDPYYKGDGAFLKIAFHARAFPGRRAVLVDDARVKNSILERFGEQIARHYIELPSYLTHTV